MSPGDATPGRGKGVAELDLELPKNACHGHFPGRPLVPGVVQLIAVSEALRRVEARDRCSSVVAMPRVRFRRPVGPDDRIRMTADPVDAGWRFSLVVGGTVVTDGTMVLGEAFDWRGEVGDLPSPRTDLPPITTLLPHRPPMLLVESVIDDWSAADDGPAEGACIGRVGSDAPLVVGETLPAVALVEVAAQALAVLEGLGREREESSTLGFLVGVSDAAVGRRSVPVGVPVIARVARAEVAGPLVRAEASVSLAGDEVVRCALSAWVGGVS